MKSKNDINLNDISYKVPEITELIKEKHGNYIKKYIKDLTKIIAEDELRRERILAKISLIAKILVEQKVITNYNAVDICSSKDNFTKSLALYSNFSPLPIYILNSGHGLMITNNVSTSVSKKLNILLQNEGDILLNFEDVLSEDYDWVNFSNFLLTSIHECMYAKKDVMASYMKRFLKE